MDYQTDKRFNSRTYSKDYLVSSPDKIRVDAILNLIGKNKKVLDLGCRDGFIMERIKAQGNMVMGVEVSTPAVKKARRRGFTIYNLSLNNSNWTEKINKKFNVVWAGEIIEHIFDTDRFLENIKRVLSKKGELILSTPNVASLGRRLLLFLGKSPILETTARGYDAGHLRYFTFGTLRTLLEEHDFEIMSMQSSVVNFSLTGNSYSKLFANIFPRLGNTIIVKAIKK